MGRIIVALPFGTVNLREATAPRLSVIKIAPRRDGMRNLGDMSRLDETERL